MNDDTQIGGSNTRFPLTRHSVVNAMRSADPAIRNQSFDTILDSYWKPVYKYVRLKWRASNEEAKDLTQSFFLQVIERNMLARYEPQKAAFRTYLRLCLDGFVANERKAGRRLKRGGDVRTVSFDFISAENELQCRGASCDIDECFHVEWIRNLFSSAVETVRRSCIGRGKGTQFNLFERYDLHGEIADSRPSYNQLAVEFGLTVTQVTNFLAAARREFRAAVLEKLRALTGSEAEFQSEVRQLLGENVK